MVKNRRKERKKRKKGVGWLQIECFKHSPPRLLTLESFLKNIVMHYNKHRLTESALSGASHFINLTTETVTRVISSQIAKSTCIQKTDEGQTARAVYKLCCLKCTAPNNEGGWGWGGDRREMCEVASLQVTCCSSLFHSLSLSLSFPRSFTVVVACCRGE